MKIWKTLLLVYRELDVRLPVDSRKRRFHHVASEQEVADALDWFAGFPQLASELTRGKAGIEYEIVRPGSCANFSYPRIVITFLALALRHSIRSG